MLQIRPEDIEKKSFEILTSQMDKDRLKFYTNDELLVVKRTIHTTADFDYQYNVIFQNNAIETLKYCIHHYRLFQILITQFSFISILI